MLLTLKPIWRFHWAPVVMLKISWLVTIQTDTNPMPRPVEILLKIETHVEIKTSVPVIGIARHTAPNERLVFG